MRSSHGLSLRRTASLLREQGFSVSHNAVHKYERGRRVPAEYVRAFCAAFGCRPEWLLSGEGPPLKASWKPHGERGSSPPNEGSGPSPSAADERMRPGDLLRQSSEEWAARARREWKRFVEEGRATEALRSTIVRSWERSRIAGVEPASEDDDALRPPRLPAERIQSLLERHRRLIDAASPHLDWVSSLHREIEHVVYLANADGLVLERRSVPNALAERWALLPGHDWSEETMGTNGCGTAVAVGRPTAVIGAEHYVEAYHGCTCIAAPIFGEDGEVAGAIDLSTTLEESDPRRLAVVAYAARNIGRAFAGTDE